MGPALCRREIRKPGPTVKRVSRTRGACWHRSSQPGRHGCRRAQPRLPNAGYLPRGVCPPRRCMRSCRTRSRHGWPLSHALGGRRRGAAVRRTARPHGCVSRCWGAAHRAQRLAGAWRPGHDRPVRGPRSSPSWPDCSLPASLDADRRDRSPGRRGQRRRAGATRAPARRPRRSRASRNTGPRRQWTSFATDSSGAAGDGTRKEAPSPRCMRCARSRNRGGAQTR